MEPEEKDQLVALVMTSLMVAVLLVELVHIVVVDQEKQNVDWEVAKPLEDVQVVGIAAPAVQVGEVMDKVEMVVQCLEMVELAAAVAAGTAVAVAPTMVTAAAEAATPNHGYSKMFPMHKEFAAATVS